MAKPSKSEIGYWISTALFYVFGGLFILNSCESIALTKLGIKSIAPDNLRTAPESLRLGLAVEKYPQDDTDISTTKSFKELQDKLAAYAERLELMDKQRTVHQIILIILYPASAFALFAFGAMKRRARTELANERFSEL